MDKQTTNKRQTSEQQHKNDKNEENDKNIKENPLSKDKGQKKSYAQLRSVSEKRQFEREFLAEHDVKEGSELWSALIDWFDYKRDIKKSYKSEISLRMLLTELHNMSNGNTKTAIAIINRSIANNYQGLIAPKENNNKSKLPVGMIPGEESIGKFTGVKSEDIFKD